MDGILRKARVPFAPESGQGGGAGGPLRPSRPLVPGIPTRVVDSSGVVKHRVRGSNERSTPESPDSAESQGQLVVGRDIRFVGDIRACARLVVHGEVEAKLPAEALSIGPEGRFRGTADVQEADVAGRFDGDLTVRGRLTIHAGGRVEGRARYGELTVEAGGELAGDIDIVGADADPAAVAPERPEAPPEATPEAPQEASETAPDQPGDATGGAPAAAPAPDAAPAERDPERAGAAPDTSTSDLAAPDLPAPDLPADRDAAPEAHAGSEAGAAGTADNPGAAERSASAPAAPASAPPPDAQASAGDGEPGTNERTTGRTQPAGAASDEATRRRFKQAERARRLREYAERDL